MHPVDLGKIHFTGIFLSLIKILHRHKLSRRRARSVENSVRASGNSATSTFWRVPIACWTNPWILRESQLSVEAPWIQPQQIPTDHLPAQSVPKVSKLVPEEPPITAIVVRSQVPRLRSHLLLGWTKMTSRPKRSKPLKRNSCTGCYLEKIQNWDEELLPGKTINVIRGRGI